MTEETYTEKGFNVTIWQDTDTESPLEYEKPFAITYKSGSRYTLGNEPVSDPQEWKAEKVSEYIAGYYETWDSNTDTLGEERANTALDNHFNRLFIALPVFAHIHGGIALNCGGFNCPWDSGQSGAIYASRKAIRKEWGCKRVSEKELTRIMESIVNEFSQWVNGECYGFTIEDKYGETVEACGGIIGREAVDNEVESILGYHAEKQAEKPTLYQNAANVALAHCA